MTRQTTIKVIKRGQLERSEDKPQISEAVEPLEKVTAKELAATVEEWITEFQKTRTSQHSALKRKLGW